MTENRACAATPFTKQCSSSEPATTCRENDQLEHDQSMHGPSHRDNGLLLALPGSHDSGGTACDSNDSRSTSSLETTKIPKKIDVVGENRPSIFAMHMQITQSTQAHAGTRFTANQQTTKKREEA